MDTCFQDRFSSGQVNVCISVLYVCVEVCYCMFIIAIYVNSTIDSSLNTGANTSVTIIVQRIATLKSGGHIARKTMIEVVKNFSSSVYGSEDEVSVLGLQRDRVGCEWRRLGLFGKP